MRIRIPTDLLGKAITCCEAVGMTLEAWIAKAFRDYGNVSERVPGGSRTGSKVVVCPDWLAEEDPDVIRGRMAAAVSQEYETAWMKGIEDAIVQMAGYTGRTVEDVRADVLHRIESGKSLTV